ncbi:MAG TPA: IS1595 family transposase [Chthoniobacterales bacterium]|jgi:transposase-like protein|nr:IS1595 family transposase [Chthoniobacterales bacterium]
MKKKTGGFPQTLHDAIKYFSNEENAFNFIKAIRWPDGVVKCPTCGSAKLSFLSTRKLWKCKNAHAKQQFSVKVGTVLEDSAITLDKWLCAFWLIVNAKNGISSYELHRAIGVTQKTAWFMLQRIRLAMQQGSIEKMKGRVEADETFIGGLARNMHKSKKKHLGTGGAGKVAVMGLLERNAPDGGSRVRCKVVPNVRRGALDPAVRQNVETGSEVITDAFPSYESLSDAYVHQVIDHAECYAKDHVHTNGLENFWSLLKRALKGTYVNVEPFHLFRYLDEQAFRFNERKENDAGRFVKALRGITGKGLRYAKLIGGDGIQQAWQAT